MDQSQVVELLGDAGVLLIVGMVFVFLFLSLLIASVKVIAWFCQRFPEQQETAAVSRASRAVATSTGDGLSAAKVAAISAAVHQYRKSH